jgi:hypothetical protein
VKRLGGASVTVHGLTRASTRSSTLGMLLGSMDFPAEKIRLGLALIRHNVRNRKRREAAPCK